MHHVCLWIEQRSPDVQHERDTQVTRMTGQLQTPTLHRISSLIYVLLHGYAVQQTHSYPGAHISGSKAANSASRNPAAYANHVVHELVR